MITQALADDLLLGSEEQQITLGLHNSSKYSGWSEEFYSFDGLNAFFDVQLLRLLFQAFRAALSAPIRIGDTIIRIFHSFLNFQARSK